jgi:hypothetical protein
MEAVAPRRLDAAAFGFFASCIAAAAMIGWMALNVNHERTCALGESVGHDFCAPPAPGSAAEAEMLRARIARNPGDANAYTALALADTSERHDELVAIASQLAPREPNLLLHRAAAALDQRDWAAAVPPLVELADRRDLAGASSSLAYLVSIGQAQLLEPYLTPGSQWLQRMLAQMRAAGASFSGALPLVIRALQRGVIDAETVRSYVRDLKAVGAGGDAYALWLSLHGKSLPILYNASFDRDFELDGFDWEAPSANTPARRVGVTVERRRAEERGSVLDLSFTGRPVGLPILRQYLFTGPGHYRLHGDYRGREFRMEDGLVWAVRCGKDSAGLSAPLRDTGGLWRTFEFDFKLPADCGMVASLQLETANPADATLGARGRMFFDNFSLERTGP